MLSYALIQSRSVVIWCHVRSLRTSDPLPSSVQLGSSLQTSQRRRLTQGIIHKLTSHVGVEACRQLFKSYESNWNRGRGKLRATRAYLLQPGAVEKCHNNKSSYGFSYISFTRTDPKTKQAARCLSLIYARCAPRSLTRAGVFKESENGERSTRRVGLASCVLLRCSL